MSAAMVVILLPIEGSETSSPESDDSTRGIATGREACEEIIKAGILTVAPVTPRLIDRGDLFAALDRAATRKAMINSAPAGSGKTPLLRAWAGH
jgi:hypothetical protein